MHAKKWINSQRRLSQRWIATTLAVTLLSGCSLAQKLVYRIDINQGNYIEQSDVNKLKFGMSKDQVRYVLGSPMLVENGFPNTWFYIYYYAQGHKDPIQKNLTVTFNNDNVLVDIKGDFSESDVFFEKIN